MSRVWGPAPHLDVAIHALHSADPVATLRGQWPHMSVESCQRYVDEATPLENAGDNVQLGVVARRFVHDVNATWPPLPPPLRWTRAEVLLLIGAGLLAALLIVAAVITK